jgi:hypothetical protein
MPLVKTNTEIAIPNHESPNKNQYRTICQLISKLDIDDMYRAENTTLHTLNNIRLDKQNGPNGAANLAVQINNGETASAFISAKSLDTKNVEIKKGVRNAAISALNQSLDTGTNWTVTGINQ